MNHAQVYGLCVLAWLGGVNAAAGAVHASMKAAGKLPPASYMALIFVGSAVLWPWFLPWYGATFVYAACRWLWKRLDGAEGRAIAEEEDERSEIARFAENVRDALDRRPEAGPFDLKRPEEAAAFAASVVVSIYRQRDGHPLDAIEEMADAADIMHRLAVTASFGRLSGLREAGGDDDG